MSILQTLRKSDWFSGQEKYCTLKSGRGYPPVDDERLRPLVEGLRKRGGILIDLTAKATAFTALAGMVNDIHANSGLDDETPYFSWTLEDMREFVKRVPKLYLGTMKPLADLMSRYWVDMSPKNRRKFGTPHGILKGMFACPNPAEAATYTDPGELTRWLKEFGLDHDYIHSGVVFEVNPGGWQHWNKALSGLLTPTLREQALVVKLSDEEGVQSPLPLPVGFMKPVAQMQWDMN